MMALPAKEGAEVERLLALARKLIGEVQFCVAATAGETGDCNARIVQHRALAEDWSIDFLTNRRCRKVRDVERTGRMTLLFQHDRDRSYICLVGPALVVDAVELKRARWTAAHYRWNPAGPDDPDTVYLRLVTQKVEMWNAAHQVMPAPEGYSAAVLTRDGKGWRLSAT